MIFLGDLAIAPEDVIEHDGFSKIFGDKPLCINLEGAITYKKRSPKSGLINTNKILDYFKEFNLSVVSLSNNHISDQKFGINETISFFKNKKIQTTGADIKKNIFQKPIYISEYQIISFGWEVIGCIRSKIGQPGIYNLIPHDVINQVKNLIKENPKKKTIIIFHWNYELERFPQPAHRQLSKILIDLGAYLIIGHHPHVVSPIEIYKGKCIVYSLGNWAISRKRFFQKRLDFPVDCNYRIAFEISSDKFIIHHCNFKNNVIKYIKSEEVNPNDFSLKPIFQDYTHQEYIKWFKKNRIKRTLLPIYKNINQKKLNKIKDLFVFIRHTLIITLLSLRLKQFRK